MRAAILHSYGAVPEVGDFDAPTPGDGQAVVEMLAAGLNPVDRSIASGSFYAGSPDVPYVVGREGVGRLADGTRVYFNSVAPFGTFAERALAVADEVMPVPDGVDDGLATVFGIAGMAAWLGLEWRGRLQAGETVLVLGASGPVGQVAVQAARLLGAGRVVAAARSQAGLTRAREDGADAAVMLGGSVEEMANAMGEACGGGPDVVLDPLWGDPGLAALTVVNPFGRHVQLGQSAGAEASVTSSAIRGKPIAIVGHTNFAAPFEVRRDAYERMARHAAAGELTAEVERVPLEAAADAWTRLDDSPGRKLVLIP